jgi:hypothetical protein
VDLAYLSSDRGSVDSWKNFEEAFANVVARIYKVIEDSLQYQNRQPVKKNEGSGYSSPITVVFCIIS